jgi:hypothetical protein
MRLSAPTLAPWLVSGVFLASCGSSDQGDQLLAPVPPCSASQLVATDLGVEIQQPCDGTSVHLLPRVQIDGAWHGAGADGACAAQGSEVRCPAGAAGVVTAQVAGTTVQARFVASASAAVQAISLEGDAELPGATAWLSNGFQSWSQTGVISLSPGPSEDDLSKALAARGDAEVDRYGDELSW